MVNSEILNTIIIASIPALITGFIGSGFLTSDYFKESLDPIILIDFKKLDNKAKLEINNLGKSQATNFTFFLKSPHLIKEIKNFFSVEEIYIKNNTLTELITVGDKKDINDTFVELYIPKLIYGGGSLIHLDIIFDSIKNLTVDNLELIATYDQGSAEGFYSNAFTMSDLTNLDLYATLINPDSYYYLIYKNPLPVYIFVFSVIFLIIEVLFYFLIIPKKKKEQLFFSDILSLKINLKEMHDSNNYQNIDNIFNTSFWGEVKMKYTREYPSFKNNYQISSFIVDLLYNLKVIKTTNNITLKHNTTIESIKLIEKIISQLNRSKKFI